MLCFANSVDPGSHGISLVNYHQLTSNHPLEDTLGVIPPVIDNFLISWFSFHLKGHWKFGAETSM